MTCRTAQQLVSSSPLLFRQCDATCYGRKQSLAVLRWLAARPRGSNVVLYLNMLALKVPLNPQRDAALSICRGPTWRSLPSGDTRVGLVPPALPAWMLCGESTPGCPSPITALPPGVCFICRLWDLRIDLTGSWLACLPRLRVLYCRGRGPVLGSICGQLKALRELTFECGWEVPSTRPEEELMSHLLAPCDVTLQPGSIPAGLTSISFRYCTMPQLPPEVAAATGLKALRLEGCDVHLGTSSDGEGSLELDPTLSSLTALETLQLQRLDLQMQLTLPAALASLTRLQHLDVAQTLVCHGGEQAVVNACQQLSGLTCLAIAAEDWASLQAEPGSLSSLIELISIDPGSLSSLISISIELRLMLPPHCDDHRLPLLKAASRLQRLLVCTSWLLCEDNLGMLAELAELRHLAVW